MNTRAAIYCRISQDRTGAGLGVARQREDCEALAARLGWTVSEVYEDNDTSAYSGKARPGYGAMLDAIRAGRIGAVLAWHEDRLHRSPRELEDYIEVCGPKSVPTQFAQAGELDLATASGRMTARIRGAVSRQESEHKSERIIRAQQQAAAAGKWLGGAPPFGWNVKDDGSATVNRREAREVREASKAILAGMSLGSVVADLNTRGITTSTGRPWNYTSIRQVLVRPRNAGLATWHGEVVGTSTWPPIVTEDTYRGIVAILSDPSRRRSTSNRARWLLAGIAVCGADGCGLPLKSATVVKNRAHGTNRTVYRCPATGTGHVARSAEAVDDHVERVILGLLARPDFTIATASTKGTSDAEALRVDAVALRLQQGEVADMYVRREITGPQLAQMTRDLQDRLDDVEAAMAGGARGSALAAFTGRDPAKVWHGLTMDRKRAVVRELMAVTVLPSGKRGNGYDPALVRIEPRDNS